MLLNHFFFKDETSDCKLLQGNYKGTFREELQKTESAKLCSSIVTHLRPGANAMTWESRSHTCWAEFESPSIRSAQCLSCKTCLLGNYICVGNIKVDYRLILRFEWFLNYCYF